MNTGPEVIRILTVDDHPLLREGIAALVNAEPDMRIIAEASNGQQAIEQFRSQRTQLFQSGDQPLRCKLDGLDRQWHEAGSNQRSATHTTLPAGLYTFRVQGATNRGAWSEPGLALRIEVLPPRWSTWWLRILCAAACLRAAWIVYQLRISQMRHQKRKPRDVIDTIPTFAWTVLPDGSVDFVNRPSQEYTASPRRIPRDWAGRTPFTSRISNGISRNGMPL
jgi:CheY-like chemotaxis protein